MFTRIYGLIDYVCNVMFLWVMQDATFSVRFVLCLRVDVDSQQKLLPAG